MGATLAGSLRTLHVHRPLDAEPPRAALRQRDGEWWYRHTYAVSGEVRPRGPFASREEAIADTDDIDDTDDTDDTDPPTTPTTPTGLEG